MAGFKPARPPFPNLVGFIQNLSTTAKTTREQIAG